MPFCLDSQLSGVKLRLAHLIGPPQPRMFELQLRILLRRKGDRLRLIWPEFDGLHDADPFDLSAEFATNGE